LKNTDSKNSIEIILVEFLIVNYFNEFTSDFNRVVIN